MSSRNRKTVLMGGLVTALALAGAAQTAQAAPSEKKAAPSEAASSTSSQERREHFDSRRSGANGKTLERRAAVNSAKPKAAVLALKKQLGSQGIVTIDALTGSPRQVARTNGFLTARSKASPKAIALAYVKAHGDVFGLDDGAFNALRLRKTYTDLDGTRHLSFVQQVGGVPVFGNGLVAHIAKDGRIVAFTGSPLTTVSGIAAPEPGISAAAARESAIKDAGGKASSARQTLVGGATKQTRFDGGDRAQLVWFKTVGKTVLAWQAQVSPKAKELYSSVVDAASGRVLYRNTLTDNDTARVWENYPGAAEGGTQRQVTMPSRWLPRNSVVLQGDNAHAFIDINDDNAASQREEIRRSSRGHFDFPFTTFPSNVAGISCTSTFPCSWDPTEPDSWRTNASQNATQAFYYVNKFHDHLEAAPIGFNEAAGNFEGDDAVDTQALDGANTDSGLPDADHIDNANMSTPPDGQAPTMQMYLFHQPGATAAQDPFLMSNGGDDASIVYHEYTHGLSNRLVVDANGASTLGNIQAGSMGEAWSDWYAEDFLVKNGYVDDTDADGDVRVGEYVGAGQDLIRTQPLDCSVGSTSAKCPGLPGKPGGYTYGDFGEILGTPEVHADGEIWGETLWDLRDRIGSRATESLVTRAMSLSPSNPSYLDERNAILQADLVQGGDRQRAIWRVFAARGMGYFASALNGDDSTPVEDFSMPPNRNTPKGSITGTVTDDATDAAIEDAVVSVGGHASAPGFNEYLAARTDADGDYSINGVFYGTYHDVSASKPGYDQKVVDELTRPGPVHHARLRTEA